MIKNHQYPACLSCKGLKIGERIRRAAIRRAREGPVTNEEDMLDEGIEMVLPGKKNTLKVDEK